MAFYLNPFSRIVAHNFAGKTITIPSAGTITTADLWTTSFLDIPCEDCNITDFVDFGPAYQTRALFNFTAPMLNCDQFDWVVKGRTSGVKTYMGWSKEILALWGDCVDFNEFCFADINPGGWEVCHVLVGTSRHQASEPDFGTDNGWLVPSGQWRVHTRCFDQTQRGYTDGEQVDVTFTISDPVTITLIEDWTGADIRITTSSAHGLRDLAYFTISDTVNYNGTYRVKSVTSTLITCEGTYVSDETSGTLEFKYDGP